jgi:hypothetical protein
MNDLMSRMHTRRIWPYAVSGILLILILCFSIGEWLGWPFLAEPLARKLSEKIDREVSFSSVISPESANHDIRGVTPFQIRFLGGLHIQATQVKIAAPSWSKAPHSLLGHHVVADFRYIDLWRAYRSQGLSIKSLQAQSLDLDLQRLANGNATWKISPTNPNSRSPSLPSFGSFQVKTGALHYQDAIANADIKAKFSFTAPEDTRIASTKDAVSNTAKNTKPASAPPVLRVEASGYYKKLRMKAELFSSASLPTKLDKTTEVPVDLTLNGSLGRAAISFKGSAKDALHPANFSGSFTLKGPSMAALGDLVGVTLPTTSAFSTKGYINKELTTWHVALNNLDLGASHLNGKFVYEKGRKVPLLSGQLNGSKFLLTDLGPAFGSADSEKSKHKVLPSRPFDLASLRAMDADIMINVKYVDLNSKMLEPLSPLRGHLQLKSGVLTIQDLDARTAKGMLNGDLKLDGRGKIALWNANLRWNGVRLENWVRQVRDEGLAPYVSGKLNGKATLNGQGVSSAEMLATMKGSIQSELQGGAISHLLIEAAGLDLAQSLGVMFKGDDSLPLQCAVADLVAENGVLRPRVMVLDTEDSALWLDGAVSLAKETIDLRVVVMPKDFSPVSLRSPLHVNGTFANPHTSLEKRNIGLKLAGSVLLAMINPLAAFIPLLDNGDVKEAKMHAANCKALMQHTLAKPKK